MTILGRGQAETSNPWTVMRHFYDSAALLAA